MVTAPKKAGIYCRLSYAPDGSVENVERQEGDCRQLADRLAWPVSEAHIFRDNSRSAWQRNRKRPAWDELLSAIEADEIDSIIVYHGDRLIRQPLDLELLLNIAREKGIRLASPSGTRDLDNPDHQFILRIEAAQACKSSDDTSRRVRRGWAARAKQGRPSGGGKRPFGFEPDLETIRESEAKLLAEAAESRLAGMSQGAAVRWLNERCTTSQGGPWTSKALKNLFLAPRIAGLVEHEGVLYEAVWDPILDKDRDRAREMWEDLKALFAQSRAESPYQGRERRYLLSGIAVCPTGHGVRTKPSGGRNRKTSRLYWCNTPGCRTRVSRNVEHLDRYVSGAVVRRLNDPELLASLNADNGDPGVAEEITALERRKAATREQLENLADLPEAVDPALLARSLASFDRRIGELKARLATSSRARLLSQMVGITAEAWEATPLDVRSATVAAVYRVTVLPATWRGPGFDPNSVRLERVKD